MEVFIGGCGLDTVEADINSHCQANGISPKKCEVVSTVSEWQKSFKLSVLATDRDKVMTSDFWPMGVYVRKYFAKKSPRTKVFFSSLKVFSLWIIGSKSLIITVHL